MALKRCSHNESDVHCLSELRIVLLGGRNSGKSLVGNTILNQEAFILQERTTCLKREVEVQGRNVIVVDTPGWWCDFTAKETPELVRTEIRRSVYLSLPGPHIFLLVAKTDSLFIEKRRRAIEEHLELLGEKVWGHTLVVFTKGKNSGDKSFEDHVKASGKPLQWLLEKCSGRFQFFDIHKTRNDTQVMELMGKITQIVERNERCHFEMDIRTLQEMEQRKREVELKAHQRLIRIQNQRANVKARSYYPKNIRLVLLGAKGSGKSSTGNSILAAGSDQRFTHKKRTTQCMIKTCTIAERQLTLVDTPGWWMNYLTQDSTAFDKQEIVNSMYLCPPGPHAFILVVRVDRSFTEIYRRATEEHLELISKEIWRHVMLLFTYGDWLGDTTIEQHIESEGKALQWLVERCGNRYHVLNNKSPGNKFQMAELLEKIEDMMAGTGVSHFKIDESIFKELERRKQEEANRVKLRRENVQRKRQSLNAFKGHIPLPKVIRVILLGGKHSGKTSASRCILGNEVKETDSQNLIRGSAIIYKKKVEVVDTPGWTTECPDSEFNKELLNNTATCVLLLVVNASFSFTFRNLRAAEGHLQALGDKAWSSTIVLFTYGDWLGDVSVEQYIESEGDALQTLVEKCGNRYHVFNNKMKDGCTQVAQLMQKIDEMMLEKMLNSAVNKERIERPLVDGELQFDRKVQMGETLITPSCSSTKNNPNLGETGFSRPLLPKTLVDLTMRSRLLQSKNQALGCRSIQLHNGNLSQSTTGQRLIVVLNTSEWLHQNDPFIGVNRIERPDLPSLSVLNVTPDDQPRHELRTLRTESQEGRLQWRCTHYTARTAKERAFVDFVQTGSLQNLIDQWGDSNIKELEEFIDSYFEMVWQETVKEVKVEECSNTSPINCEVSGITETGLKYLASIDRKLSNLDILEDVQKDLKELKQNLKDFNQILQELRDRSKEAGLYNQTSEAKESDAQ
nr:GTPase IMAP family member 8 [Misgurnus anguillicaudatus]